MKGGAAVVVKEDILRLKKERGATILAHNYCPGDVQDIADYTGDSLELARRATEITSDVIVFCGVYFMAETAAVLNPGKTVLIPDPSAGCPMADMVSAEDVRAHKASHPGAKAVCYVNSTAAVKAACDICVTSGNAERVMRTFAPSDEIFFVPDRNLGGHVASLLKRSYTLWPGCCPIHDRFTPAMLEAARAAHPSAVVLVHPECAPDVRAAADGVLSTGGMCRFAKESDAREILVGTETGILHRLRKENPDKAFYPVEPCAVCADMKKVTLDKLALCLREMKTRVTVSEEIAVGARRAIEAMLAVG